MYKMETENQRKRLQKYYAKQFFKIGNPGPFLNNYWSFQSKHYIFTTNQRKNDPMMGFEFTTSRTRVSSLNH